MSECIYQSSSSSELHSETSDITFSGHPGAVGGEYDGVIGPGLLA